MTTDDGNLLRPGECEEPFPVPPLERTYRVYMPLVDLAVADDTTAIAPPYTLGSSRFNARLVAGLDRASEAFGGIPLNALDSVDDPRWTEPVLKAVPVADPAGLIRSMSVDEDDGPTRLAMDPHDVIELLDTGATLARRADGGFVKLEIVEDAPRPAVHLVGDLDTFLSERVAVLADGRRLPVRLSSPQISQLVAGDPVVTGSGRRATVLMRIHDGLSTPAPDGTDGQGSVEPSSSEPAPGSKGRTERPPKDSPPGEPSRPAALALLLPLDQTWLLMTYERGRLVSSISLTPQEEVTVDVYSWDRRKTSREDTTTFDSEVNAESQSVDRDTRDVFGELTKSGNIGWGLNGSFSGYGLSIGGNVNNNTTVGNVARKTRQHLHEETVKASEKVHVSRQLKITESTETGSETRVTRKLRNNNLCHPVTYHYFELAARYQVTTGYAKEETVFVLLLDNPFARPSWDIDYVRTYEGVLRGALLDTAVATGLDAARMLWMLAHAAPVICNDCPCPGDRVNSQDSIQFDQAVDAVRAIGTAGGVLLANASAFQWMNYFNKLVPMARRVVQPFSGTPQSLRRALFVDALDLTAPGLLVDLVAMCGPLMSGPVTTAQLNAFNTQFGAIDPASVDAALSPEPELQTRLKGLLESRIRALYSGIAKDSFQSIINGNKTGNGFVDGVVNAAVNFVTSEKKAEDVIVDAILGAIGLSPGLGATDGNSLKLHISVAGTTLATWTSDADKGAGAAAETKRNHQTTFNAVFPAADVLAAQERFDALVRHLRAYADYYANIIVSDMISRGQFPVPTALLPYVSMVGVRPMAVVDGRLAYEIDLTSSPSFASALTLLQSVINAIPSDESTDEVSLPTPGFVVEPKLSCCSACEEFVEQSRTIDLDLHRAQADQAQREADRRALLLAPPSPTLDPFDPVEPKVRILLEKSPGTPGG